jgi:hypothetical protein
VTPQQAVADCATDVVHDTSEQRLARTPVVEYVDQPVVQEVTVQPSFDRPIGVGLASELSTDKLPRDGVKFQRRLRDLCHALMVSAPTPAQ